MRRAHARSTQAAAPLNLGLLLRMYGNSLSASLAGDTCPHGRAHVSMPMLDDAALPPIGVYKRLSRCSCKTRMAAATGLQTLCSDIRLER